MNKENLIHGGDFLIKNPNYNNVFIPEEFDEEVKMMVGTCEDFLKTEVFPNLDRIDAQENGIMQNLLKKSGEYGLLAISIPAEYEGFEQSFLTSMRTNEAIGAGHSFSVAFMAHTGIGTLPLLYYGNDEQKQKYIPRLASGDMLAAYCLTEPGAGSDANSGTSKAVLSDDGKHYILNGQKMWITNGGFADLLTVFAKIDNDRVLSAFLVERKWDGVVINAEEKKMGIKGSSTTQIFFNDVKVPVENLLGRRGEGFRIALNILHIGRIKLGGTVLGACKRAINLSVQYANERKQFGTFISSFGAIKHKLAEQVVKTFATESAVYRASADVNTMINVMKENGKSYGEANIGGVAEFAIEAALLKVYGSESLDFVADEAVQIFGGMGFSAEAPVDRSYRDSRINRIFEGTNEINRLLVIDTLIKKAPKGDYPLFEKAKSVIDEILNGNFDFNVPEDYFAEKEYYIKRFKDAVLFLIYLVDQKYHKVLMSEQEILMNLSDMLINLYTCESTLLRVQKLERTKFRNDFYRKILDILFYDSAFAINKSGNDVLNSCASCIDAENYFTALANFTRVKGVNVKDARREIADKLIEDNYYSF